ncbi:MAG: hypothetical protein HY867_04320 [Chloroflexi bacterium]|nr:hypothetical protein [Chloroflexota bacterium]
MSKEKRELSSNEYKEACENVRHFSNSLATIITLFITTFSGLVAFGFQEASTSSPAQFFMRIGGIISTILFWGLAERTSSYWRHFSKRAGELESVLGFQLHSERPKTSFPFLSTMFTSRVLFVVVLVFWIFALIALP